MSFLPDQQIVGEILFWRGRFRTVSILPDEARRVVTHVAWRAAVNVPPIANHIRETVLGMGRPTYTRANASRACDNNDIPMEYSRPDAIPPAVDRPIRFISKRGPRRHISPALDESSFDESIKARVFYFQMTHVCLDWEIGFPALWRLRNVIHRSTNASFSARFVSFKS